MKRILVIDDEESVTEVVKIILTDMGHEVETRNSSKKGKEEAIASHYDLILVDLRMPEITGAEIAEAVLAERPEANLLVITGHPSDPLVSRALAAGAKGIIKKPFEIAKILDHLK